MQILMLSAAYTGGAGGVARHVVTLSRALPRHEGVSVQVVTLAKHGEEESLKRKGRLGEWKLKREVVDEYSSRRAVFGRIFELMAGDWNLMRPTILHAHDLDSLVIGSMLRCAFKLPLVLTVHRAPVDWRTDRFQEDAKDCLLELSKDNHLVDAVVVPSLASAKVLHDQGFREVTVIPHALNKHLLSYEDDPHLLRNLGVPRHRRLVFCPVRPDEHKDPQTVIKSAGKIRRAGGPLPFFLLLDDGDDARISKELRDLADTYDLKIGDDLAFVSPLPYGQQLATVFRAADLVVVPSIRESFGQVVLDAFSFGKPVIARNTTGLREIVRHKENGLLFSTSDDLAVHIKSLLHDPDLANALAAQGTRDNDARYDLDGMVQSYLAVYSRAVQRRVRGTRLPKKKGRLPRPPL